MRKTGKRKKLQINPISWLKADQGNKEGFSLISIKYITFLSIFLVLLTAFLVEIENNIIIFFANFSFTLLSVYFLHIIFINHSCHITLEGVRQRKKTAKQATKFEI